MMLVLQNQDFIRAERQPENGLRQRYVLFQRYVNLLSMIISIFIYCDFDQFENVSETCKCVLVFDVVNQVKNTLLKQKRMYNIYIFFNTCR